ncbi:MAG TPA: CBS domain-containing protein [Roseiflexaceae bacterium]|nr:CBS domain-containing protein [Roseiflexaceae bacterium]HMP41359.1 CBS domain-containing protein [Roseiflexaceae bacterium]
MNIAHIMVQPVRVTSRDTSLDTVARLMLAHRIGCLPIVDPANRLCGIITEADFQAKERGVPFSTFRAPRIFGQWMSHEGIEHIYQAACSRTAADIMSTPVVTLTPDDSVEYAVRLMLDHHISHLPVVREGVPIGIVSRHDLLRLMLPTPHEAARGVSGG